jgi:hypothetical protein
LGQASHQHTGRKAVAAFKGRKRDANELIDRSYRRQYWRGASAGVTHNPRSAQTVLTAAWNAFKIIAMFLTLILLKFGDKVAKVRR